MFKEKDCEYTNFNIQNHKVEFDVSNDGDVIISIPFTEDTSPRIKEFLNKTIFQEMNCCLKTVRCMPNPCILMLNASMQIRYCNNKEVEPQYSISIVIKDIPEVDVTTWVDKTIDVKAKEFFIEFMLHCQFQMEKALFPYWNK